MSRRKPLAILIVLAVVSSGIFGWYYLTLPVPVEEDTGPIDYEPHPYNSLNWWEIAIDMADFPDLLTPLGEIVARGNRYNDDDTGNSHYLQAADYVINRLQSWGISADYEGDHDAVLGYQEGYGTDNRAIVFGAHLDSEPSGVGVRQNAAGAAVVTVIASILSEFRLPIDVYYCYFSWNTVFLDQQQTVRAMWGSKEIVSYLEANSVNVIAMYNFDEFLFVDPFQPTDERLLAMHEREVLNDYHSTRYLAELLSTALNGIHGFPIMSPDENFLEQTDHWAFLDAGYPAVNIKTGHSIDPENAPQDSITSQSYDLTQAEELARAAAAVAVYLALQGNGEDTSYKLQRSLAGGSSAYIQTVMSVEQLVSIDGTKSENGTLLFTLSGSGGIYLEQTGATNTNFSLTASNPCSLGAFTLQVRNSGNESIDFELYLRYQSDTDGNGVLDKTQYSWPDPDPPLDWDKDGLSDADEVLAGTDIFVPDTDEDSISDGTEAFYGLDPLRDDTTEDLDDDGLNNLREIQLGTHPGTNDTDSDAMDDLWEVLFHTDPLVDDSMLDPDNDTLTNLEEYTYGADPLSADGDYDDVPDAEEVERGMNPLSDDSDNDGLRDKLELIEGLDPLTPDYDIDLSPDGGDHNPRINTIIVIAMITVVPVVIGTIYFKRKLK